MEGAASKVREFEYTSECAFDGHPDKLADAIADSILDECMSQDIDSKVAVEVCVHKGLVVLLGEIASKAKVNFEEVARETCRRIGYDSPAAGLDCNTMDVVNRLEAQSPDVAQAVHGHFTKAVEELGAGDSGVVCGYATDETPELMPLTHLLATRLARQASQVRQSGACPWIRPDGCAQVTGKYRVGEQGELRLVSIETVTLLVQHAQDVSDQRVRDEVMEHVVRPVLPPRFSYQSATIQINPAGRFCIGGPDNRAGVSGRRLADDTYGGWAAHGGGSISGKDCSKVDRTASYAARWVAVSLVKAGLCARCSVQVSYAISLTQPVALSIDSYGTAKAGLSDEDLRREAADSFDLRPGAIIEELDLQALRTQDLAVHGHFGRKSGGEAEHAWEVPKALSSVSA